MISMAEIPNRGSGPSWRVSGEGETNTGAPAKMGGLQESTVDDSSVAIDIESLLLLTVANNKDSTRSPRLSLQRNLSRKGSRRGGGGAGERKAATSDTTSSNNFPSTSGAGACDKSTLLLPVHVACEKEPCGLPKASSPTATAAAAGGGGGRCRRLGKRPSPWLDPRRVLLLFATLSSMGTLILLYFTLYTGKRDGGDGR